MSKCFGFWDTTLLGLCPEPHLGLPSSVPNGQSLLSTPAKFSQIQHVDGSTFSNKTGLSFSAAVDGFNSQNSGDMTDLPPKTENQ